MSTRAFLGGSANDPAVKMQRSVAIAVTAFTTMLTVLLLPFANQPGPTIPGFLPMYQVCLIVAYGLGGWVVLTQFLRERSFPLLLVACGALYTAEIVLFQLLSFPGVFGSAPVLGAGSETTTWLWTFWHIGPPVFALAYAWARLNSDSPPLSSERSRPAAFWAVLFSLLASGVALLTASFGLKWLPKQVSGNDYSAVVTSGVGPAVQLLTFLALLAAWMATRARQTVLDLWIAVALVLLVLDNFLTMKGGSRDSIGWYVGRIEALVSAFAILWAYLSEVDGLRVRAEAFAEEAERAGAALRQAQKMEAIGRLTGGIAHDFNNLLMVISSGFDMIIRRPADQARVLKTAEMGREAAERGARLTRQLMTFAHKQNLAPETLNLNTSLVEFEALARRALGDAVTFKMELYPALHLIRVDRGELESAVLNLVVNRATP
jgi:signal transduction histidine kinase